MFEAAAKALSQILSPSMRAILWKSAGAALVLIAIVAVALQRLLSWLVTYGATTADGALGPAFDMPINIMTWILSIAAGLGIVLGSVFLMPAVTSLVASLFVDDIAAEVERAHYPADAPGQALPIMRAGVEGLKTALLAVLVYLVALPFVFIAGLGLVAFFVATAFILSREYFELAAMRFRTPEEAKALRKQHAGTVFAAGLFIAAFVAIPIVNLATPLFGMALMVHIHKRISGSRPELIEPAAARGQVR
jgi:CysZ protein